MNIPLIGVSTDKDHGLIAGRIRFDGLTPYIDGGTDYRETVRSIPKDGDERHPILIVDVSGLQKGGIDTMLLKSLKIRGASTWFMTHIVTVDDLFDAFNTDADMILVPIHTVLSRSELTDMHDVSDSIIPAIIVRNGVSSFCGRRYRPDVLTEMITDMGFPSAAVFDIDGTITADMWGRICTSCDALTFGYDKAELSETRFTEIL